MWPAGVRKNDVGLAWDYATTKTRDKVGEGHGKSTSVVGRIVAPQSRPRSKSPEPMNVLG